MLRICSSRTFLRLVLALLLLLLLVNLFTLELPPRSVKPVPSSPSLVDNDLPDTDWSRYAYCQYVTNQAYLCNSLMIFERLHSLGSKAERLVMYPEDWTLDELDPSPEARLLMKARDEYRVRLVPIHIQHLAGDTTWEDSFTKLLAFNQTQYDRVISLDSDSTILQVS